MAATSAKSFNLLGNFEIAGASTLGMTIIRTHARLQIENFAAVTDFLEYGFIVGRDTDVAANLPNVDSDSELDWMLRDVMFPTSSAATVDAIREFVIDNRAKRKMDEMGQNYVLNVYNPTAAGKTIQVYARTLMALP